ncbi:MAG: formylglycine-generating enzyme family protein [Treponema sp.]|nr:formylglycine-generating enzyme family protein [Treponema sp.]
MICHNIKYSKLLCVLILTCLVMPGFSAGPIKPTMIAVRGGTFFMGSNENRVTERVHEVTLRSFLLSDTPVTQELYKTVMGENPSAFTDDNNPVESVSWFDAVRFCNALSALNGLSPAYTINGKDVSWNRSSKGYRLPTEAEWEFAARGGLNGPSGPQDKVFFAGGNESANPLDYCWFFMNARTATRTVRGKFPNQLGLYDMSGNVWEWCWDWHADYPVDPVVDYAGPATGKNRIYRGGSYYNNLNQLRASFRISDPPEHTATTKGFRIAQNG